MANNKETLQQKMSKAVSDYYNEEKGNRVSSYSIETLGRIVIGIAQAEVSAATAQLKETNDKLTEENTALRADITLLQSRQAGEE